MLLFPSILLSHHQPLGHLVGKQPPWFGILASSRRILLSDITSVRETGLLGGRRLIGAPGIGLTIL